MVIIIVLIVLALQTYLIDISKKCIRIFVRIILMKYVIKSLNNLVGVINYSPLVRYIAKQPTLVYFFK